MALTFDDEDLRVILVGMRLLRRRADRVYGDDVESVCCRHVSARSRDIMLRIENEREGEAYAPYER